MSAVSAVADAVESVVCPCTVSLEIVEVASVVCPTATRLVVVAFVVVRLVKNPVVPVRREEKKFVEVADVKVGVSENV